MGVTTSQQLQKYLDLYSNHEVAFTKDVIKATLLYPKQIFVKCLGYQWPCLLYSSSMVGARIIINLQSGFRQIVAKANNTLSLRFSFLQRDKPDPLAFFVNAKIVDYMPYSSENPDLSFINITYTNKVPDDLIEKLGQLIEAQASAQNRKEERLILTPEVIKETGISPKSVSLTIDNIPRKGILRDIAFSGAKMIILGVPKFLVGKAGILKMKLDNPEEIIELQGTVIRFERIEGRTDIGAFIIQFKDGTIPIEYHLRLNRYFKNSKPRRNNEKELIP